MAVTIAHRCIHARDIHETLAFYTGLLGLTTRENSQFPDKGIMFSRDNIDSPDPVIADYINALVTEKLPTLYAMPAVKQFDIAGIFMAVPGTESTGPWIDTFLWNYPPYANHEAYEEVNHVGFARLEFLVDDFEGTRERLREAGARFISEEIVIPAGVLPDGPVGPTRAMSLRDPNNIVIVLIEA
ncbi:VOC family protein [Micromonospora radicis]|uniref:Glyoxalase/fosfomycin resistance/dioxygenase domain-containing protein n=1 Tax=Micromonospora radicis TaxID=1894971 RepID=A0A418MPQ1_9ACTN|nr:VOC family protein [Micromonospora radicis]RIV34580.1 hypothetical protein D2L64_21985 [Micromonospora radicis]